MYGGLAGFVVKPEKRAEFLELVGWSARIARNEEPWTLRLDVWEVGDSLVERWTMVIPFTHSVVSNADEQA